MNDVNEMKQDIGEIQEIIMGSFWNFSFGLS